MRRRTSSWPIGTLHLDDGDDDYARGPDGPWHFDVAPTGALSNESLRVALRLAQEGRNVGPIGQWGREPRRPEHHRLGREAA